MDVDEQETFQQQALEVRQPDEDFDPNAPPLNGEEYLMHMVYERKRCPAVVSKTPKVLKAKSNKMPTTVPNNIQDERTNNADFVANRDLLPTKEWKDVQSGDFLRTRSKIMMLRQHLHNHNYDNTLEPPLISDEDAWLTFCQENLPKLSVILRLNQRSLEQLLELISDWLKGQNMEEGTSSSSSAATQAVFDLSSSDQWLGSWLYAVLSCLHLPLEPGVHSTLRDIARTCIELRSRLKAQEYQKAVPYNLFIYLIAKIFDQLDLLEFM